MQAGQNIENPFNIQLPQCNHIINIQYHKNPKTQKISLEKGNLFLGGVDAYEEAIINGFNITAALTIIGKQRYVQCEIREKIEQFNIQKHKWIDIRDKAEEDISIYFDQTYNFIKESLKEHNVLVHCFFGRSRSACIVIAFLMRQLNLKYSEVFQMVISKRKQVKPNEGFDVQLIEFEKKIFG